MKTPPLPRVVIQTFRTQNNPRPVVPFSFCPDTTGLLSGSICTLSHIAFKSLSRDQSDSMHSCVKTVIFMRQQKTLRHLRTLA